jgi:hypothetical protein
LYVQRYGHQRQEALPALRFGKKNKLTQKNNLQHYQGVFYIKKMIIIKNIM